MLRQRFGVDAAAGFAGMLRRLPGQQQAQLEIRMGRREFAQLVDEAQLLALARPFHVAGRPPFEIAPARGDLGDLLGELELARGQPRHVAERRGVPALRILTLADRVRELCFEALPLDNGLVQLRFEAALLVEYPRELRGELLLARPQFGGCGGALLFGPRVRGLGRRLRLRELTR